MSEKIKCYEIDPSGNSGFDTLIIEDKKQSWQEVMNFVEESLESQFLNDVPWDEIKVTVRCVYKTRQELDELETE